MDTLEFNSFDLLDFPPPHRASQRRTVVAADTQC